MALGAFIAGAATVSGAAVIQGGFAYLLERRRSSDARRVSREEQHLTARTAYRLVLAEVTVNRMALLTSSQQGTWWPHAMAPQVVDWNTYRDTMARHLEIDGLLHELAVAYSNLQILIAMRKGEEAPDEVGLPLTPSDQKGVETTLERFNECFEYLVQIGR